MRMNLLVCVSSLLGLVVSLQTSAQTNTKVHSEVSRTLDGMNSAKWTDRAKAFSEMPRLADLDRQDPAEADRLKVGVIHLLAVENAETTATVSDSDARSENNIEEHDEEYSNYYANLIGTVADLNDARAIPALIGAITTGGMATRGLAKFGDKALNPVLDQLQSPDPDVRSSVLFTIRDLLEMHIAISAGSLAHINEALGSALGDRDVAVRRSAISALEYLPDRAPFVPALQKLAETDPAKLPGKPDDGGDQGQFYPVRQDARRLLRKIANHESPVVDKRVSH